MLWVKRKCPYILSATVVTAIQSRSSMCDTINVITVETAAVSWWGKKASPPPTHTHKKPTNKQKHFTMKESVEENVNTLIRSTQCVHRL